MRLIFCCFLTLCVVFGAEVSIAESDFIERVINFIIFFSILWYLGADKIKDLFIQRSNGIATQFEELQAQEKKLKKQREETEGRLLEAKTRSEEIIASAKRRAFEIATESKERLEQDVRLMSNSFDEMLRGERRKMLQDETLAILGQSSADLHLSSDAAAKVLMKGLEQ